MVSSFVNFGGHKLLADLSPWASAL